MTASGEQNDMHLRLEYDIIKLIIGNIYLIVSDKSHKYVEEAKQHVENEKEGMR